MVAVGAPMYTPMVEDQRRGMERTCNRGGAKKRKRESHSNGASDTQLK